VIVLDTNVISGLMREPRETAVLAWLDRQPSEAVWTTSVSILEIRFGIELLARGRQRRALEDAFGQVLSTLLEERILPFDRSAAEASGAMAAERQRRGRPVDFRDLQIAGIAFARKGILATRNTAHFEGVGLTLVDPWTA